ncbi:MAG TPA: hypothetical protein VJT09_03045 [Pyrinomonadaceae bacterium]|nr:hypothetical protein [Pyrinomonadaceae bacterium]
MKNASTPVGPWTVISILGLIAAAILLARGYYEATFVAGTLGAVAWFLNYRSKLKSTIEESEPEDDDEDDAVEDEDEG